MTPSQQCKQAGLKSLAELIELSRIPKQTLIDWHKKEPRKFEIAIMGVLYEKGKSNEQSRAEA